MLFTCNDLAAPTASPVIPLLLWRNEAQNFPPLVRRVEAPLINSLFMQVELTCTTPLGWVEALFLSSAYAGLRTDFHSSVYTSSSNSYSASRYHIHPLLPWAEAPIISLLTSLC